MFDEYQICPYTGLRSFTEEESIYFKGREEHIDQATEQLQRNKFLMLTGASGDGKSSLVYAGIVPNARAGFLKSKYTQWRVADFRPERSPLKNLCRALARQLEIAHVQTVEAEIQHGFSALVDLYKNSKCFVDVESVAWRNADETQKASLKRTAANLIIIVDQFEEFFTNPENYHHGVPSQDSNLVLNVLLETARIALEEDLPIYIVFTMRSDYIGQCAAFRSLPEYIGFSQFFVPRLNRSQLQQVIEEPATLSGNKISRRLTERLIHDIAEGVDQLPILQHALNQIWHAASQGKEEMDLIHYAMVGGMSSEELPDNQVSQFSQWFNKLPDKIKQFYQEPNLQNVLDTHANKLFESAAEHFRSKTTKGLSDEVAKAIIKTTFICLTKIDQSRAVRNRMTLREITNILGRPEITTGDVGAVLDIYREPGNTFIRPFITDDAETTILNDTDVLDITHESLIRNWEYLGQWAQEEFNNYTISLDFEQQLNRWVESDKSNGFLLSIGPLTYFENWFNAANPNAYWIARYLPEDIDPEKKLSKSKQVLANAKEFLKRSARKHIVTRTFIQYGTRKVATVLGVLIIITLSSFAFRDYLHKQNSYVLNSIKKESFQLANGKRVAFNEKVILLCEQLRLGQITLAEIVNGIKDPIERINVAGGIPMALVFQGRDEPRDIILHSLLITDSLLEAYPKDELNKNKLSGLFKENNDFGVTLDVALFYNHDPRIKELRQKNARRGAQWVLHIVDKEPAGYNDMRNLAVALDNSLNRAAFTEAELDTLIQSLSTFVGNKKSEWHQTLFKADNLLVKGNYGYGFKFNGLYQELAYLYAATGNSDMALRCIDSLLYHNSNYFSKDYNSMLDNASNIASVFYLNGKESGLDQFVKGYCTRKKITEEEFYNALVARFSNSNFINLTLHLHPFMNTTANHGMRFADIDQISFFYSKYREIVQASAKDIDLSNYLTAVSYKNEAMLKSVFSRGFSEKLNTDLVWPLFDKAFEHYKKVKLEFLESQMEMTLLTDIIKLSRRAFFSYPDFLSVHHSTEPRNGSLFYNSDAFLKYILEKGEFNSLYAKEDDLKNISFWLIDYDQAIYNSPAHFIREIDYTALVQLESELRKNKLNNTLDLNLLYFHLGKKAADLKEGEKAVHYYSQVKKENLLAALRTDDRVIRLIAYAIIDLIKLDHFEDAYALIRSFKNNINRSNLYAFASVELSRKKQNQEIIPRLLDSARVEMNRTKDLTTGQPNREQLAFALTMYNPSKNQAEAYQVIKNVGGKSNAIMRMAGAHAFHGNLFEGLQNIPDNISYTDRARFLWRLIYSLQDGMDNTDKSWDQYTNGHRWWIAQWIPYEDDNG